MWMMLGRVFSLSLLFLWVEVPESAWVERSNGVLLPSRYAVQRRFPFLLEKACLFAGFALMQDAGKPLRLRRTVPVAVVWAAYKSKNNFGEVK